MTFNAKRKRFLQIAALQDCRYNANPARHFLPEKFGKTFYALTHSDMPIRTTDAGGALYRVEQC